LAQAILAQATVEQFCFPGFTPVACMAAIDLVYEAHGALLRDLAVCSGRHFQGLSQAVRFFSSSLSSRQRRYLTNLDATLNVIRHITLPKISMEHTFIMEAVRTSSGPVSDDKLDAMIDTASDDSASAESPSCTSWSASPALFDIFDVRTDSAAQTEVSMANARVSGDPDVSVATAINNAFASLAVVVQGRAAELGALAGDPLPPVGDSLADLPAPVLDDLPDDPLDLAAVYACRRNLARLLVSRNRLAAEIKAMAMVVDDDFNNTFLSNFADGLRDFLWLSTMGDSFLIIDLAVLAYHLASQVIIGSDGWLAHLASAHSALLAWGPVDSQRADESPVVLLGVLSFP